MPISLVEFRHQSITTSNDASMTVKVKNLYNPENIIEVNHFEMLAETRAFAFYSPAGHGLCPQCTIGCEYNDGDDWAFEPNPGVCECENCGDKCEGSE